MATAYNLVVVTPERVLLDDQVTMTIAPGADGELGILANHASLMTGLRPGEVKVTLADGRTTAHIIVSGGFLEVAPERTTVLADFAERADEIDITRAETDLAAARAMLADAVLGSPEAIEAQQALQHAETRIRASRGTGR